MVWIEGVSGSGKSYLAHQLKRPAQEAKCFFATGKFDLPQQQRREQSTHQATNRLYQGIQLALGQLCEQILALPRRGEQQQEQQQQEEKFNDNNSLKTPLLNECDKGNNSRNSSSTIDQARRSDSNGDNAHQESSSAFWLCFEDAKALLINELQESFDVLDLVIPNLHLLREDGNANDTQYSTGSNAITTTLNTVTQSQPSVRRAKNIVHFNLKEVADRMRYACRRFMELVSHYMAPTLLVLEDLQWADPASLDLLYHWITDSETGALMIVGTYRSDEVGNTSGATACHHPLRKTIHRVENYAPSCAVTKTIILQNLGISEIEDLLETLVDDAALGSLLDLADIVLERSGGNSFHVIKFIQLLAKRQLLYYDDDDQSWCWDIEMIRSQTESIDNIDLLMKELLHQSSVARQVLPVAACLGSTFNSSILFRVYTHLIDANPAFIGLLLGEITNSLGDNFVLRRDADAIEYLLTECVQEGFIDMVSSNTYCFIHDRVQEAALNLFSASNVSELEFQIGEAILLSCDSESEENDMTVSILDMLNPKAIALKASDPKRMKISILNEKAAGQALKFLAFESASWYYRRALSLLPPDRWSCPHYDRTLSMYISAATAEAGKGDNEAMLSYANAVQVNAKNVYDKLPLYHMMIGWFFSKEEPQSSYEIGKKALSELGVRLPENELILTTSMIFGLLKSKSLVSKIVDVDIDEMPIANDRKDKAIMLTLGRMAPSAYTMNGKLLAVIMLTMMRRSIYFGLTDNACSAWSSYGFLSTNLLNDYDLGKKCGKKAIELAQRTKCKKMVARVTYVTYGMNFHFMDPMESIIAPLQDGIQQGIKAGDFESAFLCSTICTGALMECGRSLPTVASHCAYFTQLAEDFGNHKSSQTIRWIWQKILELMGSDFALTGFAPLEINEVEIALTAKKDKGSLAAFRAFHMVNALYLGEHELGANMALDVSDSAQKEGRGMVVTVTMRFANSLSCYDMSQNHKYNQVCTDMVNKRKKYLSFAKKTHKQIHKWVELGNPNCRHYAALLDAESSIINDESEMRIVGHFEEALAFAVKDGGGLIHIQALILERYALFWKRLGKKTEFQAQAVAAMNLYQKWGAHAKVLRLSREWGPDLGDLFK